MGSLAEISVSDVATRRGTKGDLTTGSVAIYTVDANSAPEVVDVLLANIHASNATTFNLVLAATGENGTTGTEVALAEAIAAKTRVRITGIPMAAGDALYALSAAATVSYIVSTQKERTGDTAH